MTTRSADGTIVTFYSWKGGVGRTMALANIAVQLARMGKSVLMVDWDLEAPGLDRFFLSGDAFGNGKVLPGRAADPTGLMGLLYNAFVGECEDLKESDWRNRLMRLIIPAEPSFRRSPPERPCHIDLLAAGHTDSTFSTMLAAFSWSDFFGKVQGGDWLEMLRGQWSAAYEYVLIDSRAGLTDSGGVCTVQMPHMLVLVFTANEQSLDGGLRVVAAAQSERRAFGYDRGPLVVVPMLSRWEGENEVDIGEQWMKRLDWELASLTAPWLPGKFSPRQFLEKTRVPHVPRFSFGEPLPVLTHSLADPGLPGLYFDTMARLIRSHMTDAGIVINPNFSNDPALQENELRDIGIWIENVGQQFAENPIGALIQAKDLDKRYDSASDAETLLRQESFGAVS